MELQLEELVVETFVLIMVAFAIERATVVKPHIAVLLLLLFEQVTTTVFFDVRPDTRFDTKLIEGCDEPERVHVTVADTGEAVAAEDFATRRAALLLEVPRTPEVAVFGVLADDVVSVTAPFDLEFKAPRTALPNDTLAVVVDFFKAAYINNTSFPAMEPLSKP